MKNSIKKVYKIARQAHTETFLHLQASSKDIMESQRIEDFIDIVYAFKEAERLYEDIQRDLRKKIYTINKIVCLLAVEQNLTGLIKTDYVTAKPQTKMSTTIPSAKKDREGFNRLCKEMNIPAPYYTGERPVINIDWLGASEYMSKCLANGEQMPRGFEYFKKTPQMDVRLYSGREIE